jgi:methyltransferase (TIGR00027 family)
MEDAIPSGSAQRVAMRRAAHQLLDQPVVFADPLAIPIVDSDKDSILNFERASGLRAYLAARSRFSEDLLARARNGEDCQYVILGAGLDTFAYRNPSQAGKIKVFEIDHPATQKWKLERLERCGIAIPNTVTFVPNDLEIANPGKALCEAGFQPESPAFFACMGVLPYLTSESFARIATFIGGCRPGSKFVFDYALPPWFLNGPERAAHERVLARMAEKGEPFRFFLEPPALAKQLKEFGFGCVRDLSASDLDALYFTDRQDGLQIGSMMGRLAHATAG